MLFTTLLQPLVFVHELIYNGRERWQARPLTFRPVDYSAGFSFFAISLTSSIAFFTSSISLQAANLSATKFSITSICLSVIFSTASSFLRLPGYYRPVSLSVIIIYTIFYILSMSFYILFYIFYTFPFIL